MAAGKPDNFRTGNRRGGSPEAGDERAAQGGQYGGAHRVKPLAILCNVPASSALMKRLERHNLIAALHSPQDTFSEMGHLVAGA